MSDSKKENLFAKLAKQQARPETEEVSDAREVAADDPPPSPAPVGTAKPKTAPAHKKPVPVGGKRHNPDYCQANSYIPKKVRRAVDRALLDMEGMDYSKLVEELLRKWLKSRGLAE